MTYDTYHLIFVISMIASGVMLAVTIVLFFVLRIPSVIGDLSGRTARRAIENIRNQNEASGEKVFKSSKVNRDRGRITDKISSSGNLQSCQSGGTGAMSTERIAPQANKNRPTKQQGNETTILRKDWMNCEPSEETTILKGTEKIPITDEFSGQTTLLCEAETSAVLTSGETTLLTAENNMNLEVADASEFSIIYEKTLVSTNEIVF